MRVPSAFAGLWLAALAAPAVPAAGPSASSRPVALSRMVVDLEPGARIGKYKSGSLCLGGPKFLWKRGSAPRLDDRDFEDSFRVQILRLGFKSMDDPSDLFAGVTTGGAEYLVAGKIEAIDINVCYPNDGLGSVEKSKGRASIRVNWQIYSRAKGTILASFTSTGDAASAESRTDGPHAILMEAFGSSLRQLTEQPSFRAVFGAPGAR